MTQVDRAPVLATTTLVGWARLTHRVAALPAWGRVLVIYGVSRLLTTTLLVAVYLIVSAAHGQLGDSIGTPNFPDFLVMWDSRYYREIAVQGYPTRLPIDIDGDVI